MILAALAHTMQQLSCIAIITVDARKLRLHADEEANLIETYTQREFTGALSHLNEEKGEKK